MQRSIFRHGHQNDTLVRFCSVHQSPRNPDPANADARTTENCTERRDTFTSDQQPAHSRSCASGDRPKAYQPTSISLMELSVMKRSLYLSFSLLLTTTCVLHAAEKPWTIHTIDPSTQSRRGADGIRLADANSDGLVDTVTG